MTVETLVHLIILISSVVGPLTIILVDPAHKWRTTEK